MLKKNLALFFTLSFLVISMTGIAQDRVPGLPGKYRILKNKEAKPVPKPGSLNVVKIREVFSFSCVHCYRFNKNVIPALKKIFQKKLVIEGSPIANSGPYPAALYYIARAKGKGEEVKTFIFNAVFESHIQQINDPVILEYIADNFGLADDFKKEKDAPEIQAQVRSGRQYATDFDVKGTPTVIIEDSLSVSGDGRNLMLIINALLKEPIKSSP